jgi:hypothetical protein
MVYLEPCAGDGREETKRDFEVSGSRECGIQVEVVDVDGGEDGCVIRYRGVEEQLGSCGIDRGTGGWVVSWRCTAPRDTSSILDDFIVIEGIKLCLDDWVCGGDAGALGDYVISLEGHSTGLNDKTAYFSVHGGLPSGEIGSSNSLFIMNEEGGIRWVRSGDDRGSGGNFGITL